MATSVATGPVALIGAWDFERVIVDRAAGREHRVTGTTDLVAERPGRVRWSERGVLSYVGRQISVSRDLCLEERADGWFVTFDDGRDFHPWTPGAPVEHLCGADIYVGIIDLPSDEPARWTVRWRVTGPSKDYVMSTVLTRRLSSQQATTVAAT